MEKQTRIIETLSDDELDCVVGGEMSGIITGGMVAQMTGGGVQLVVFATKDMHGVLVSSQ